MTVTFRLNEFWIAGIVLALTMWMIGVRTVRHMYRQNLKLKDHEQFPAILFGLLWVVCPVWLPFYGLVQAVVAQPPEE